MKNKKLRPYMVSDGEPYECAILVFHFTSRKARYFGWSYWEGDAEYIQMEAKWMKGNKFMMDLCEKDEPHAIDGPPLCRSCEHWGGISKDGDICEDCQEEKKAFKEGKKIK